MLSGVAVINIFPDRVKDFRSDVIGRAVEDDEINRHVLLFQEMTDGIDRDLQRLLLRIAVNARRDQRKGNGFTAVFLCKFERFPIAG
jgi:hypothetical protein